MIRSGSFVCIDILMDFDIFEQKVYLKYAYLEAQNEEGKLEEILYQNIVLSKYRQTEVSNSN